MKTENWSNELKTVSTDRDENRSTSITKFLTLCLSSPFHRMPLTTVLFPCPLSSSCYYHLSRNFSLSSSSPPSFFVPPPTPSVLETPDRSDGGQVGRANFALPAPSSPPSTDQSCWSEGLIGRQLLGSFSLGVHSASILTLRCSACAANSITVAHSGNRVVINLFTT